MNIHPNPSKGLFSVISRDFHYSKIEIIDIKGRLILNEFVNYKSIRPIFLNIESGDYLLKLSSNDEFHLLNLIIE